jgi:hypothetical protein
MAEQVLVLEPGRADHHDWADLWRYRELFFILAWRDVSVRYKQTVIGLLWAILRPFATMGGSPPAARPGWHRARLGRPPTAGLAADVAGKVGKIVGVSVRKDMSLMKSCAVWAKHRR